MNAKRFPKMAATAALLALLVVSCGGAPQAATPTKTTQPAATAAPLASVVTAAQPAASAGATQVPVSTVAPAPTAAPAGTAAPTIAPSTTAPTAVPTAEPTARPQAGPVAVSLSDIAIKLDRSFAASGSVTFAVKNVGTVIHEVVVLKTNIPQNQIPVSTTQPGMVTQPGFIATTSTINPGGSATLSLTLGAGSYVLLCNQPAHYLIGMHTAFTIN